MAEVKVVPDTNILVSSLVFGGEPEKILFLIQRKKIIGVTSKVLVAELCEILLKKFNFSKERVLQLEHKMRKSFQVVYPRKTISVSRDPDDNRVLEAAVEGSCNFIVTGDKDLLILKKYKKVTVLTPSEFLKVIPN